ncbi:MAG TPA: hypothetical protein ENK18_22545 [Deltaproteobacteria bacterium]|nr:hypothetical protein [Deltaproteobacteria bacterium]
MWIAAVILAAVGIPGAAAVGISVSPVALLALPWVALERRSVGPLIEGLVVVLGLTVLSAGGWWLGERGLLRGPPPRPGRTLSAWIETLPWLLLLALLLPGARGRRDRPALQLLVLLPLGLAPPDVPAWSLGGIVLARAVARRGSVGARALVVGQLWLGIGGAQARSKQVRAEAEVIAHLVDTLGPDDALVAPWTWGARVSVAATKDPYGLIWRPPDGWLRDQATRWAEAAPTRAAWLPPGSGEGRSDASGVRWSSIP